jgi:hypothetical protein
VLLGAGVLSDGVLARWGLLGPGAGATGKEILGWSVVFLGVAVPTGIDKLLEAIVVTLFPAWICGL